MHNNIVLIGFVITRLTTSDRQARHAVYHIMRVLHAQCQLWCWSERKERPYSASRKWFFQEVIDLAVALSTVLLWWARWKWLLQEAATSLTGVPGSWTRVQSLPLGSHNRKLVLPAIWFWQALLSGVACAAECLLASPYLQGF